MTTELYVVLYRLRIFAPHPAAQKKTIEKSLSRRSYAEWMIAIFRPARSLLNAALVVWLGYKAVRRLVEIGLKAKK